MEMRESGKDTNNNNNVPVAPGTMNIRVTNSTPETLHRIARSKPI